MASRKVNTNMRKLFARIRAEINSETANYRLLCIEKRMPKVREYDV